MTKRYELLQDLQEKYEGTYIGIILYNNSGEGDTYPFLVDSISPGNESRVFLRGSVFSPEREWVPIKIQNDDAALVYKYPEQGYVNTGFYAIYSRRSPRRQWKWGYTEDTATIQNISNLEYVELIENNTKVQVAEKRKYLISPTNSKYLLPLFSNLLSGRKYPSYSEAFHEVASGKALSRAFSKEYAVSVNLGLSHYILWYKTNVIGHGSHEGIHLNPAASFLIEDISQYSKVL